MDHQGNYLCACMCVIWILCRCTVLTSTVFGIACWIADQRLFWHALSLIWLSVYGLLFLFGSQRISGLVLDTWGASISQSAVSLNIMVLSDKQIFSIACIAMLHILLVYFSLGNVCSLILLKIVWNIVVFHADIFIIIFNYYYSQQYVFVYLQ